LASALGATIPKVLSTAARVTPHLDTILHGVAPSAKTFARGLALTATLTFAFLEESEFFFLSPERSTVTSVTPTIELSASIIELAELLELAAELADGLAGESPPSSLSITIAEVYVFVPLIVIVSKVGTHIVCNWLCPIVG